MTNEAKALFITHPSYLDHKTGDGHPESPERLRAILPVLEALLQKVEAKKANINELEIAHEQNYIKKICKSIPTEGISFLDPDTSISSGSLDAALYAAGASIQAVDLILTNKAKFIFNAVRPPGHHATGSTQCGFCLFNNIAIAALYALKKCKVERIAIIDPDVHHCNGTQDILWEEEKALLISTHQSPLFPYTGTVEERGRYDTIMNIPLQEGCTGKEMKDIYTKQVFPRVKAFKPDLILVSAGFDAHKDDPLASLAWETKDYGWLGHELKKLADDLCQGRIIASLEGGYNLQALAASVSAFIKPFTG